MKLLGRLLAAGRGIVVALLLLQSALVASAVALLPAMGLLLVPAWQGRLAFRRLCQIMQEAWFGFACSLLHYGLGIDLFLHVPADLGGLQGLRKRCAWKDVVLIANHRTRIDWMFLWGLCLAMGRLGSMKIVLKDSLKKVPGFGWAMQCFGFVFLSRRSKEGDLEELQGKVEYHCREPGPGLTLLLFPEGTDLSENNIKRSHDFSKQKGLQVYNEVLHPKTAGFCAAVAAAGPSSVILDATMGYVEHSPGERPNEKALFTGRPPRQVHIRLTVPTTSAWDQDGTAMYGPSAGGDGLAELCKALFKEKEQRLSEFTAPVRKGGHGPHVAALAEGCDEVALASAAGARWRLAAGSAAVVALEVCAFWAAARWPLGAAALGLGAAAVFCGASLCCGGVDGLERRHAATWPAPLPRASPVANEGSSSASDDSASDCRSRI